MSTKVTYLSICLDRRTIVEQLRSDLRRLEKGNNYYLMVETSPRQINEIIYNKLEPIVIVFEHSFYTRKIFRAFTKHMKYL